MTSEKDPERVGVTGSRCRKQGLVRPLGVSAITQPIVTLSAFVTDLPDETSPQLRRSQRQSCPDEGPRRSRRAECSIARWQRRGLPLHRAKQHSRRAASARGIGEHCAMIDPADAPRFDWRPLNDDAQIAVRDGRVTGIVYAVKGGNGDERGLRVLRGSPR